MRGLLGLVLLLATQTAQPILLTDVARQLTADDLGQIEALSKGLGRGQPWLLRGSAIGMRRRWQVRAYLPPISNGNGVRRGETIGMQVDLPEDLRQRKAWGYAVSSSYYSAFAQIALPGRSLDDVRDDRDLTLPFLVSDEFSDDELRSIVGFIRAEAAKWTERDLPIEIISRSSIRPRGFPIVHVVLLNESVGHHLELSRDGDGWSLVEHYTSFF